MPDAWPVTIRTPEGDFVEVDTLPATGRVYIGTSSAGVLLSAAQFEEFSQACVAARWASGQRVPSAHAMHCQCAAARQERLEMGASGA